MKLASILVPIYLPASHVGATPTPYQSGTVDKFEKALAALSPQYLTRETVTRLAPDSVGRFLLQYIMTRYEFEAPPEMTTLADAIDLTLKSFGLAKVTAIRGDEAEDFNLSAAEELASGLHPWSDI